MYIRSNLLILSFIRSYIVFFSNVNFLRVGLDYKPGPFVATFKPGKRDTIVNIITYSDSEREEPYEYFYVGPDQWSSLLMPSSVGNIQVQIVDVEGKP